MPDYPEGDTHDSRQVPSMIPFPDMNPGAPDGRGFSAPEAALASSMGVMVNPDGSCSTDYKATSIGNGQPDISADGGTP